jgi:PqqA peptide cyclase
MPEPCRSCERRAEDFGGCRCQALLLTGKAAATDPVCSLAPAHNIVEKTLNRVNESETPVLHTVLNPWVYRPNPR